MKIISITAAAAVAALAIGSLGAAAVTGKNVTQAPEAADSYRDIEAMSYVFGSKRAVGYFRGMSGKCHLTLMIAEAVDPDLAVPTSAARLSLALAPGQNADLRSVEGDAMTLTCGPNADVVRVKRVSVPAS